MASAVPSQPPWFQHVDTEQPSVPAHDVRRARSAVETHSASLSRMNRLVPPLVLPSMRVMPSSPDNDVSTPLSYTHSAPGSHVILRTEGRPDPPQESVLEASELAVHFSKQKNASRADVHVVPIKNVRKPKGTKKGLVYVTGGKTVHLRREEARLGRVLQSRIDD